MKRQEKLLLKASVGLNLRKFTQPRITHALNSLYFEKMQISPFPEDHQNWKNQELQTKTPSQSEGVFYHHKNLIYYFEVAYGFANCFQILCHIFPQKFILANLHQRIFKTYRSFQVFNHFSSITSTKFKNVFGLMVFGGERKGTSKITFLNIESSKLQ